ncbi:MAG TPA: hypothetical protein VF886_11075 [Roseiarcus sp.]|jgi:hypothetical protein
MAILIFVLSLVLLIAGAASGYESLDLLPDTLGVLYALAGAVGVAAAAVTLAIGLAVLRIDALAKLIRLPAVPAVPNATSERETALAALDTTPKIEPAPAEETSFEPVAVEPEAPSSLDEAVAAENESPININRAGHLPSLDAIETVLETPEAPPSMIGSYSSAGANYKIFADGSIEAETSEGTFKFASMGDFKRHLDEAKAKATPTTE